MGKYQKRKIAGGKKVVRSGGEKVRKEERKKLKEVKKLFGGDEVL